MSAASVAFVVYSALMLAVVASAVWAALTPPPAASPAGPVDLHDADTDVDPDDEPGEPVTPIAPHPYTGDDTDWEAFDRARAGWQRSRSRVPV